jgi:hypothetical protein
MSGFIVSCINIRLSMDQRLKITEITTKRAPWQTPLHLEVLAAAEVLLRVTLAGSVSEVASLLGATEKTKTQFTSSLFFNYLKYIF